MGIVGEVGGCWKRWRSLAGAAFDAPLTTAAWRKAGTTSF